MADLILRPANGADIADLYGNLGPTVRAIAGEVDGQVVGIGGLAFVKGIVLAFADLDDEMRRRPIALHKAALGFLRQAKQAGHRHVFAECDRNIPRARPWLERLGFRPVDDDGTVMLWQG